MPDMQLECKDCHQPFTFTEKDQAFYAQQGYTNPKRCKPCRLKNKQRIAARPAGNER